MEAPEWFNCCASGDACRHCPDPGPAKWFWSFVTTLETSFRTNLVTISTAFPVQDSKYAEEHLATDKTWCPRNFLHTYRLASLRYHQRGGKGEACSNFSGARGRQFEVQMSLKLWGGQSSILFITKCSIKSFGKVQLESYENQKIGLMIAEEI